MFYVILVSKPLLSQQVYYLVLNQFISVNLYKVWSVFFGNKTIHLYLTWIVWISVCLYNIYYFIILFILLNKRLKGYNLLSNNFKIQHPCGYWTFDVTHDNKNHWKHNACNIFKQCSDLTVLYCLWNSWRLLRDPALNNLIDTTVLNVQILFTVLWCCLFF